LRPGNDLLYRNRDAKRYTHSLIHRCPGDTNMHFNCVVLRKCAVIKGSLQL